MSELKSWTFVHTYIYSTGILILSPLKCKLKTPKNPWHYSSMLQTQITVYKVIQDCQVKSEFSDVHSIHKFRNSHEFSPEIGPHRTKLTLGWVLKLGASNQVQVQMPCSPRTPTHTRIFRMLLTSCGITTEGKTGEKEALRVAHTALLSDDGHCHLLLH